MEKKIYIKSLLEEDTEQERGMARLTEIYPGETLAAFQQIAEEFNVRVNVLKKEGEEYTYQSRDTAGKRQSFTGPVPEGCVYIEFIVARTTDLEPFHKKAEEIVAAQGTKSTTQ